MSRMQLKINEIISMRTVSTGVLWEGECVQFTFGIEKQRTRKRLGTVTRLTSNL